MDVHSTKIRSYNMSRIKGKNTNPEILVRRWLFQKGYRYRLHYKRLPSRPDIVFTCCHKVIFVNGCFWHHHEKCKDSHWPATNKKYWKSKITKNMQRDKSNYKSLHALGWDYIIIWECELKEGINKTVEIKLINFLK